MNGLIVAGGDINDKFVCDLIKQGAFEVIFAVDRGIDMLYRNHITPDIIVGDFDSANPEALEYYRDMDQVAVSELEVMKDDTDTEHAVRDAIRLGCNHLTIVGAFGSRVDHMLANISLLGIGLTYRVEMYILDEKNRVHLHDCDFTIKKSEQYGDYVSLIAFGGPVRDLTVSGMKYNLKDASLNVSTSLGVSNEIVEDEANIIFNEGTVLAIETRD